jgi:tetratricopeptide (TPR) repeat protein
MTTSATPAEKKPAASHRQRIKGNDQDALIGTAARASYPRTHFEKGLYYKQIRNPNAALVEFLKATQENPHLVHGFYEQALIFRQRGYLKLAESALEQALAAKPDYSDARVLLATVRLQQGNVGGAVQELSRTLGLNIDDEKDPHKGNSPAIPIVLQSIHKEIKEEKRQTAPSVSKKNPTVSRAETPPKQKQDQHKDENSSDQSSTNSAINTEAESSKPQNVAKRLDLANVKDSIESALRTSFSNRWHLFSFATPKDSDLKDGSEIKNQDESTNSQDSKKSEQAKQKKKKAKRSRRDDVATTSDTATTPDTANESAPKEEKRKKRRFHFRRPAKEQINSSEKEPSTSPENSDLVQSPAAAQAVNDNADSIAHTKGERQEPGAEGNKLAFQVPSLEAAGHGLFNSFAPSASPSTANAAATLRAVPAVHLDSDSWAKKMKYLQEHGTNSLKDGEAFMFSEETGEGVLFLGDGQVIRRTIAGSRDAQDVVRERRPDIIAPAEVLYNLSLLGKLMPKSEPLQQQQQQSQSQADQSGIQRLAPPQHGDFKVDDLMGNSQSFWGWLKSVLKL